MTDSSHELTSLDLATLSSMLRAREISPLELTDAYLGRISELDGKINAFITVTADLAREQARNAEVEIVKGRWRGPFHGMPVALKDLCYTKGIRTTAASKILGDFVPDYDATVWTKLREAGAVLLGKLNLHEFAYGFYSTSPHFGPVRNPYSLDRIAGGSSGGSSAATVAGMAAATIGTDTGGSIRVPSAMCGCVGLKPTLARVSRHGVIPLSATLDHVGPITRTVRDAALMLNVIAGHDPNDSTSSGAPVPDYTAGLDAGIKGLRIGLIREQAVGLEPEVEQGFKQALRQLESLGATVEEVSIPALDTTLAIIGPIIWADALEYHEHWMRTRPNDYGPDVRRLLEMGFTTTAVSYIRAQRERGRLHAQVLDALDGRAVLVSPVNNRTAPRIDEIIAQLERGEATPDQFLRFTGPFDATGQPAVVVPSGLSAGGLPLSMQLIGRLFDEATVLRVANAFEAARGPLPPPKL